MKTNIPYLTKTSDCLFEGVNGINVFAEIGLLYNSYIVKDDAETDQLH